MTTQERLIAAREAGVKMRVVADAAGVTWRKVYSISSNTPPTGCKAVPDFTPEEDSLINKALDVIKAAF